MTASQVRVDAALLDRLDAEAERFSAGLTREYYLNHAGLKDTLEIAPLYQAHGWLFEEPLVRALLAARSRDPRLPNLRLFAVEGYLEAAAKELTEAVAARETQDTVAWEGREVPYRGLSRLIANEPDPDRRRALEALRTQVVAAQNPLREERWLALHGRARSLGYPTYAALMEHAAGLDLAGLRRTMGRFLEETDTPYRERLERELRRIGVEPAAAERADLAHLFRAPGFDGLFPRERLLAAYAATMADLGIDVAAQAAVRLDTEARPRKSPRAFCAPVHVPGEIYLVISPQGGQDDYRAFLHEAGHAQHFAHMEPGMPFAFRGLGDNAITEGFAFTLEHLTHEPGWLARHLGVADAAAYVSFVRFHTLYMVRRYAAKLEYELALHGPDDPRSKAKVYADTLTACLGVRWSPADYLADVDDGFYAARYLRAWIFDAVLRAALRRRFGPAWYASAEAGAALRELWRQGQRRPVEDLARELDGGLDAGPLLAEVLS
ncbi:MAG TPA: hypothetical protein VIO14_13125 [Dehalococcoidia bacterium]